MEQFNDFRLTSWVQQGMTRVVESVGQTTVKVALAAALSAFTLSATASNIAESTDARSDVEAAQFLAAAYQASPDPVSVEVRALERSFQERLATFSSAEFSDIDPKLLDFADSLLAK